MNLAVNEAMTGAGGDLPGPSPAQAELSISEMVRMFDTTERTLRFYESRGLLAPPRKGQVRRYDPESRRKFKLILEGRRLGFSLSQIAEMLESAGHADELRFTEERLRGHIEMLEEKHRKIEAALVDLRKRYYLMRVVFPEANELQDEPTPARLAQG
jgi:DNA-binding transcriptional MerR regulator